LAADQHILCLGYGYVAERFANLAAAAGYAARGTIRNAARAGALEESGVEPVLWSEAGIDAGAFDKVVAALVSTPPIDAHCPSLKAAADALAERARDIRWIGYLSSNGVYGDHGGAVVDETSPLLARTPRAMNRVRAEAAWASHAAACGMPLVVFRLPGIYGPGRSALDTVREGRAQRIVKLGQVFSRMHVDDIANALMASLVNPAAGDLFNLADDEPAPPQDVIAYACELLGVAPPPLVAIEDANLSEMARSFYLDNKRVSNALMKKALGVGLRYPTYREGLKAILNGEQPTGRLPA
jgi:nucleoside-diphosphate-sugar epimerase